jgi:hypothetical protein
MESTPAEQQEQTDMEFEQEMIEHKNLEPDHELL